MSVTPEKLKEIAERGRSDYYYCAKHILGYDRMTDDPHQALCDHIVEPGKRKKLTLMPRNSFKSSVVTEAGTVFFLLNDPNERILIASETQKNAIKYVKAIKGHFEDNRKFKALYGNWVPQSNTWRDDELIVSRRNRVFKEGSVTAGSMEKGVMTGMHYTKIILDDVVSRNNTNSPEQIEKTIEFYKLLNSILDPEGTIYINGTRWHYLDLYGWIQSEENAERDRFHIFTRKADDGEGTTIGTPLMPKVLSQEFLKEQMDTQGLTIYSHQYRNEAITAEEQTFRPEWVEWYEISPDNLYYFITIDPAISQTTDADYTGVIVNGVDYINHYWIQEAFQKRMQPSEIVQMIFEMNDRYKPMMVIGLEKFALEKLLKFALDEEMKKRGIYIPVKDVGTDNRISKEARIKALEPKFQARQIHLKKDQKALYHQIVMHPQVQHDDVLDALKTQLAITFPSDKPPSRAGLRSDAHLRPIEKEIWDKVRSFEKRRVREKGRIEI